MKQPEIMQYFTSDLQAVAIPFCNLAWQMVELLPANVQRDVALQKLLEAKDAAVRAYFTKPAEVVIDAGLVKGLSEEILNFQRDGGRIEFG